MNWVEPGGKLTQLLKKSVQTQTLQACLGTKPLLPVQFVTVDDNFMSTG